MLKWILSDVSIMKLSGDNHVKISKILLLLSIIQYKVFLPIVTIILINELFVYIIDKLDKLKTNDIYLTYGSFVKESSEYDSRYF
jgi:hypothetical protein